MSIQERGRLVINGQGQERTVYGKFEPNAPQEHQIVFPDKKVLNVDWRRNLQALKDTQDIIEAGEIVQEEGTYRVPLDKPEIGYAMGFCFSDAHIGSYTTDHQLITDVIDKVLTTPNAFLMDCGDTFNNGIWGGLGYEDTLPPYMQAFTVEDMMREVGDKWGATVLGNHSEWMFNASGLKPEMIFAKNVKGPVFPGMGLLHLEAGDQKYDVALSHNYWGKSKKNVTNCCVNLRQTEYPDAEVFIVGHEHVNAYGSEVVDGKKRHYIRPGTAKTQDRYARIHGIAKRGQPMGKAILFGTDKHDIEVYDIEDALEIMKLRESVKS